MLLKKEMEGLKSGSRLGSVCRNKEEQVAVLVSFLVSGLKNNQKCIGVLGEEIRRGLFESLLSLGVDVARCNAWGQFAFSSPEDAYLKSGQFDPDDLLAFLKNSEKEAVMDGFDGLRLAGEAKGVYGKMIALDRFFEFGLKKNDFLRRSRTIILTMYEENYFPPEFLRNVVYSYPRLVLNGKMCDNKYYIDKDGGALSGENKLLNYEELKSELLKGI